ncbi:T9SS sorting signal type C domain-containing protein [Algibacter sp. AS12]|uniref:T9SS sorting signal type C domain-containing protein n=1 Tax=Algibacter sp. AS12 TaxID=3135773 RepID=UPI00398B173C
MKKITLLILLFLAFDFGFGQEIAAFSSVANAGCSGTISNNANISTTGICRGSGININTGGTYNSRDWTTNATLDSNDYLEWTLTANSGYSIDLTTMDITYDRSGTGPTMVDIQVDTGSGYSSIFTDASVSDPAEDNNGIDLTSITGITGTITFRLYAFSANGASGTFDIEENTTTDKGIVINGLVNALPCPTATIYTGTWSNGSPDSLTKSVVISSNYSTTTEDIVGCSLTVDSGATLTIADGTFAEIENDVTINGTLVVETQGNFVQRDNAGTFTNNGTSRVNKTTATKADWYYYTYWSSPVVGETTTNVFPDVDGDRRFWFNAANFVDTDTDNVDDNADAWQYALASNGTDNMLPGVGYAVTEARLFSNFAPGTGSASFEGEFNTGDIDTNISFNAANPGTSWNFIGNPYPSAIDFDAFYTANSTEVDGTAYFWSQFTPPSGANPGNEQSNFSRNDYAMYAFGSGGVAGASGETPTQYIPSGQGFFIAGLANGPATFTNAMRMADATSNTQFFKNSSAKQNTATANRLWVNLTSDNGIFNQILVAYVDGATNGIDNGAYDAKRFLTPDFNTTLYSTIEGSNTKFAIQGKAINSLTEDEIINLGFATNIDVATLYTFSIAQLEGDFLANNIIYLKDNLLNKVHNLSDSDYSFTSEVGEFNDRFKIQFSASVLSTESNSLETNALKIVELDDNHVQFTASNNIKSISIFDLLGRQLYQFEGNNTSETYNLSQLNSGSIYIAKVELSSGAIITKKAVKK